LKTLAKVGRRQTNIKAISNYLGLNIGIIFNPSIHSFSQQLTLFHEDIFSTTQLSHLGTLKKTPKKIIEAIKFCEEVFRKGSTLLFLTELAICGYPPKIYGV